MLSLENQRLRSEKRLEKAILCAFGVGLSWGAVGVDLSKTIMIGPSEL